MFEHVITDCANGVATANRVAATDRVWSDGRRSSMDGHRSVMRAGHGATLAAVIR